MAYEGIFISAIIFLTGMLTYLFRDKPNMAIGFRIGYTFASEEAWRKTNEFAGKAFMGLGVIMGLMSLLGNVVLVTLVMIIGVSLIIWKGYIIAKETVELEDISEPAEGIVRPLDKVDVKPYILFQLALIASYIILLALSWEKMPDTVATHFNAHGSPDRFEPKSLGAFLLPLMASAFILALTYLGRDPIALRIPRGNIKVARIILELLTIIQLLLWGAFVYSLLYNAYNFSSPAVLSAITLGSIGFILVETIRLVREVI